MPKNISIDQFLIWVYQNQKASEVIDRGVGLYPAEMIADGLTPIAVSGDGCFQCEQNGLLGTRVDYSGRGTAALHPDAEYTHDLVLSRSVDKIVRGIVIEYGKSGREPEWQTADAGFVPVLGKGGKLKYIKDENRVKRGCAVQPVFTNDHRDHKRWQYTTWWDALETFRLILIERGMLKDHVLEPCSLKREPWL